ncbi:MAG: class I SAM-dependent methyltransferase [Sulfurovum sp.]
MTNSLDLYSKVEDLLGVKEASPKLYAHYLLALNSIEFNSLLDVGCGAGDFIHQMKSALDISTIKGIDLSHLMVEKTKVLGYEAQVIPLQDEELKFDVITAVFDMLNYLDTKALEEFLISIKEHLNDGGVFLCDINTLYGFESVAVGSYVVDDDDRFLTIDSDFENGVYSSEFTLFEKEDNYFKKSQEIINQYYHKVEDIVKYSRLELISKEEVSLYGFEEADKLFLVFVKK